MNITAATARATILLLSFLTGCAQAFGGPAYQALMPALVEGRAVSNAIALNSMQFNLARMIGPVLGGLALEAFGADPKALDYSGVALCFTLNHFLGWTPFRPGSFSGDDVLT